MNTFATSLTAKKKAPSNIAYVFFLTGQSNGFGPVDNVDAKASELEIKPNVHIFDAASGQFQPLKIGVNNLASLLTRHGVELRVADIWNDNFNVPVYIIKWCIGGTKMIEHLEGGSVYEVFWNDYVKPGINNLLLSGKRIYAYMNFSQGEADAILIADTNDYQAKFDTWVALWRTNLGAELPITLLGLKIDFVDTTNRTTINGIFNASSSDEFIDYIDTASIDSFDGTHYSYSGFLEIGDIMISNIKNRKPFEITEGWVIPNNEVSVAMQVIADIYDYGYTAIPSTTQPNPLTTDKNCLIDADFGDPIRGVRAIGKNIPATANLKQQQEDFSLLPGPLEDTWYMEGGIETPEWINRDDDAPFLLFHNGRRARFGINISPAPNEPIDMIFAFRYMPCVDNETIGHGLKVKGAGYMEDYQPSPTQNGDIPSSYPNWLEDQVYRVRVDGSQNWTMWKNKIQCGTGTGANISNAFVFLGSNGHPAESHYRHSGFKNGEFTSEELDDIYEACQVIAPWTKPSWPHIEEMHYNASQQWNSGGQFWDIWQNKTITFGGGNGIEGTHSYQWYYWDKSDNVKFPKDNKLDEHAKFLGADGQNSKLYRGHYTSGNGRGNDTIFNSPGVANNVYVACLVTVRDSTGTVIGVYYLSAWNQDNITPV